MAAGGQPDGRARRVDPAAPPWSALRDLAGRMDRTDVRWQLGGSALLYALGIDVPVNDLDVTVPADRLDGVLAALDDLDPQVSIGDAPPPWCSDWLVRATLDDVEVDVIGGFCVHGPEGPVPVPDEVVGALWLGDTEVPITDPAVWWWVYGAYRPDKARALAEVLPPERLAEVRARLGPPLPPPS